MPKTILLTCFVLFFQSIIAQYEKGYIITKDGENKSVLIKNQNWKNNPEKISFKTDLNESEQTIAIGDLSEFGIGETTKFIVSEVNLDVSSNNINTLIKTKNPIFEKKTLALRKLVGGTISLYEYQFSNGTRFYVDKSGEELEPLVFKKYLISDDRVGTNEHFKQQLNLLLEGKMDDLKEKLARLSYSRKSLSKLISEYNLLFNVGTTNYFEKIKKKTRISASVFGGIEQISVDYQFGNVATLNPSFPDLSRSIFGGELELLFLNERIGLFSGFTVKSGVSKEIDLQTSIPEITQRATLSFNNNSLFLGVRGYIPIVKKLDLILSAGITQDIVSNFSVTLEITQINDEFNRSSESEFFGIGVLVFKKLFTEVRFLNSRMFKENVSSSADVDQSILNFRVGYKIL